MDSPKLDQDLVSLAKEAHSQATAAPNTFLFVNPLSDLLARCSSLLSKPPGARGALYGQFFAVKDNIDVASQPTTAACPAYTQAPGESAPVVAAILDADAICLGKVNMDQFAAGLNGTRSPYGTSENAVDSRVIPGGSSSGSATAVAGGIVSFALGTDTAGSGRVPAGLQGIVGVKPSVGLVSTKGVVPACASLDCVSVFAQTVQEGAAVMTVMAGASDYTTDSTMRRPSPLAVPKTPGQVSSITFAAPDGDFFNFSGPRGAEYADACMAHYESALKKFESIGGKRSTLDFSPLCEIAKMLYETSLVAERYDGIQTFLEADKGPDTLMLGEYVDIRCDARLLPVTRAIIGAAGKYSAFDVAHDRELLSQRAAACQAPLEALDYLVVPTVMHHYLVTELLEQETADPPTWPYNSNLGKFTNFVNLLDMCAVSVPCCEFTVPSGDGAPDIRVAFGVTIIGKGMKDAALWQVASDFEASA